MPHCPWCNKEADEAAAQHEGPHATWCVHFREEQRGGDISSMSQAVNENPTIEEQTALYITYDDVLEAEGALEEAWARYLRRFGWTYTSQNPAFVWLWKRTIDGVTYMVDAKTAVSFTREAIDR
jgi:hypothetical protein